MGRVNAEVDGHFTFKTGRFQFKDEAEICFLATATYDGKNTSELSDPVCCSDCVSASMTGNSLVREGIYIYPNPVGSSLYVENGSGVVEYLQIVDVLGRIQPVNPTTLPNIDVAAFPAGSYYLQIYTMEGKNYSIPFLKK
jgi:hypothetical protein